MGNNYGSDDRIVMAAPADIAAAAAEELTTLATGHNVRYVASDDRTATEIAHVLGATIGRPELTWAIFSDEQPQTGLEKSGIPAQLAASLIELGPAFTAKLCGKTMTGTSPPMRWVRLSRKTLPGDLPLASSKDDFLRLKGAANKSQLKKPSMGAQDTGKSPLFERARPWPCTCCPGYSVAEPGSEPRGKRHKSQRLRQPKPSIGACSGHHGNMRNPTVAAPWPPSQSLLLSRTARLPAAKW